MADVKEVLAEFCQNAGTALSTLLGGDVSLSVESASEKGAEEVKAAVGGRSLLVPLEIAGDAMGSVAVVIPEDGAARAATLLTGEDSAPETLTDLHLSALSEVGSQLGEALSAALSGALGGAVTAQAGEPKVVEAGALDAEAAMAFADGSPVLAAGSLAAKGAKGALWIILSKGLGDALAQATGGFASGVSGSGSSSAPPSVRAAQLSEFAPGLAAGEAGNLDLLRDVPLQVTVELGRTSKHIREILSFAPGSIIGLDKLEGEPVDIFVNDMLFAKGEVVVIDENFGVRISEIISPKERLNQLQALTR
jgi:flagellar motor switch protein FliN/FliY